MTINFILDGIGTSGGVRMVFNLANYLIDRGHDVAILSLRGPHFAGRGNLLKLLKDFKHFALVQKFGLAKIPFPHKFPIHFVDSLAAENIANADVVIATACSTAFKMAKYPKSKGEKFYYIQGFEDWANPYGKALTSWKLPIPAIVTCKYLAKMYRQKTGKKPYAIVPCGLEERFYKCNGAIHRTINSVINDTATVLMIYNSVKFKGGDDGIKALKIVKQKFPDASISLFGIDRKIKKFKNWAKIYYFPSQKGIIELYHKADIFVSSSRKEGFGLTGLEALAGGCALVATDVGAVREYSQHNKSSLISPPKNPNALAKNIAYLLENPQEIKRLSENGFKKSLEFRMKKTGRLFEKALC